MARLGASEAEIRSLDEQAEELMSRLLGNKPSATANMAHIKNLAAIKVQSAIRSYNASALGNSRIFRA